ncbi:type II toxin-antitoxin system TacA family antitoxin [Pseudochelatococcus sp. B33]
MPQKQTKLHRNEAGRVERLGFRIDEATKNLIERAAYLSQRKVSDFCVSALADTARRTIAEHEMLMLSERDRDAFFDALINPPAPSDRLQRALADHKRRVAP